MMADLLYGPLNKSLYTQTLELVTKILLYSPNDMNFYYQNIDNSPYNYLGFSTKKELHVVIGDVDVNLSQLFSKANFSHLQMDQTDSAKFTKNTGVQYNTFLPQLFKYVTDHATLTEAEKQAVLSYQGVGYLDINDMLYKVKQGLYHDNNKVRQTVLKAVMLSSGLNKIIKDPKDHQVKTYRGERYTPQHEIQERINLVNQGGGFTEQPAYMSTSLSKDIASSPIFRGNCFIIFDSVYGTSVEKASASGFEQEYLLPPGQIFWKKYEYINGIHTFYAQAVRPLVPEKEEISPQDIANFNKLLEIAKNKGVPLSFLTPYLQTMLSIPPDLTVHSTSIPVMGTAKVTKLKDKVLNGLNIASLIGGGIYLLTIGLSIVVPPFGITLSGVALFGVACVGGVMLSKGALKLIPTIMNYIKQPAIVHDPVQPAPFPAVPSFNEPFHPAPALTAPVVAPITTASTTQGQQYKAFLEKEEKAVKELEVVLKTKFPQAPQFITKLHEILDLENANGDKLLLMQYTHLLENRVNEAHPDEFPVVEKEVLDEATTAIKEKTLFI